ncbi:MAG: hypothetical protein JNN28_13685 [Saprospiraceae bacterium]|nr:hypothetical protein [Saprospiraceae bacterium]
MESGDLFGIFSTNSHSSSITNILIINLGKTIVASHWDNSITIWNIHGNEITYGRTINPQVGKIWAISSSLNDDIIMVGGDNIGIEMWDTKSGVFLKKFAINSQYLSVSAISSDFKYFATTDENTIDIWEMDSGALISTFRGHIQSDYGVDFIQTMRFSPNNQYIATGGDDAIIMLWNIKTGKKEQTFVKHTKEIIDLIFSNDGQLLLSRGRDGLIHIWNVGQDNIESRIYPYSISQLRGKGLSLEPSDLLTLWEQSEQLTPEELSLIGKSENLPAPNT